MKPSLLLPTYRSHSPPGHSRVGGRSRCGAPAHSPASEPRSTSCSSPVVAKLLVRDIPTARWGGFHGLQVLTLPVLHSGKYASFGAKTRLLARGTHGKVRTSRSLPSRAPAYASGPVIGLKGLSLQDGEHQRFSRLPAVLPATRPKRSQRALQKKGIVRHTTHPPHNLGKRGARSWSGGKLNAWEAKVLLRAAGRTGCFSRCSCAAKIRAEDTMPQNTLLSPDQSPPSAIAEKGTDSSSLTLSECCKG